MGSLHPSRRFFSYWAKSRLFRLHPALLSVLILMVQSSESGFSLLAAPPESIRASTEKTQAVDLPGCHIAFSLPPGYTIRKRMDRWISAAPETPRRGTNPEYAPPFLIAGCNPNALRTSRITEIREGGAWDGGSVGPTVEIPLDRGIQALLYPLARVHGDRSILSQEAYFATRTEEYRVILIHGTDDQSVRDLLRSIRFLSPVEATITESQFRFRLYTFASLIAVLTGGAIAMSIRKKYGKKKEN